MKNHTARNPNSEVQARIDALKIGQKMQDLPEELWHASFKYYVKEDTSRKGGPNMRMIRLDPKKPSLTVTGFIFNKFVHPFENRFVTVREAARLQGFPDSIEFKGSITSTQQQIGNAVPVQLAEAIGKAVLESISSRDFNSNPTALSLFSGAGGFDVGIEKSTAANLKFNIKGCVEIWPDACQTLKGYFKNTAVVETDIKKIEDPKGFWRELTNSKDAPTLIFGGPPCQAFSQAGKQLGLSDVRGTLIFDFLRFVDSLKPDYFVMENVSNLKGVAGGKLLKSILDSIDEMGYNLDYDVLSAADFGAPQVRKRIIFLGTKKKLTQAKLPQPSHGKKRPFVTVGEAFSGLPKAEYNSVKKSKSKNDISV